jgi:hypothetical protein
MDHFGGLSPLLAREVCFRVWGDGETDLFTRNDHKDKAKILADTFCQMATPLPYLFTVSAQPKDFSYAPITQYGTLWQGEVYPSFSRLLDGYYAQREQDERMRQRTSALRKTAQNLLERTCRKLEAQKQELATATDRETLRQRIDERLARRVQQGMIEEVQGLLKDGASVEFLMKLGLEYRMITQHLIGEIPDRQEMLDRLALSIKQFSKRQMTWFRRDPEIQWLDMTNDPYGDAVRAIDRFLKDAPNEAP